MKTIIRMMLVCLAAVMVCGLAAAGAEDAPQIILYTCYENVFPDGIEFEAGCVDDDGNLWSFRGNLPEGELSAGVEEYLTGLLSAGMMTKTGELDSMTLFDLKSLIFSAEAQEGEVEAVGEGGGAEHSCALVADRDGNIQQILLGISGDSRFENTDPDAQALYLRLREMFPEVTCFGGAAGPAGFQPVSLVDFCGWQDIDFDHVVITGYDADCEAGPIPFEITEEQREEIIRFVQSRKVTGKANATFVTGGTSVYTFSDEKGNYLGSMELDSGLLVRNDGMYYLGE